MQFKNKNLLKYSGNHNMIKRYSSMFKYKKNIKYGFKDLISKQIISHFQWGLKISVKTALKF